MAHDQLGQQIKYCRGCRKTKLPGMDWQFSEELLVAHNRMEYTHCPDCLRTYHRSLTREEIDRINREMWASL